MNRKVTLRVDDGDDVALADAAIMHVDRYEGGETRMNSYELFRRWYLLMARDGSAADKTLRLTFMSVDLRLGQQGRLRPEPVDHAIGGYVDDDKMLVDLGFEIRLDAKLRSPKTGKVLALEDAASDPMLMLGDIDRTHIEAVADEAEHVDNECEDYDTGEADIDFAEDHGVIAAHEEDAGLKALNEISGTGADGDEPEALAKVEL